MKNKKLSALLLLVTVVALSAHAQGKENYIREVNFPQRTNQRRYPKLPQRNKDFVVPDTAVFDDKRKQKRNGPDDKMTDKKYLDSKTQKLGRQAKKALEIRKSKVVIYS